MKSATLERELIEEVRNLQPQEYSTVISRLLQEFITEIYNPKHNLKNTMMLGNRIKSLIDNAKIKQKQTLYNNWENIKDNTIANQAQELHKQHLFITKVNPIVIKFINSFNRLKINIDKFDSLFSEEYSYIGAVKKDEELFKEILEDYINIEVFLMTITSDFKELATIYLNNTLNTTIESYKEFKQEKYSIEVIRKICEEPLNNLNT